LLDRKFGKRLKRGLNPLKKIVKKKYGAVIQPKTPAEIKKQQEKDFYARL
jgi:hypothetical protein